MQKMQINRTQVREKEVNLDLIDTSTPGKSLITKLIVGDGFQKSHSGVDIGTGEVSINLSSTLAAFNSLNINGLVVKTPNGVIARTILGSSSIDVVNGNAINGNPIIDLKDTGVTAGSYRQVTVDSKGRVLSGSTAYENFIANEITTSNDNIHYRLANTPIPSALMVWVQGAKQTAGADRDFTVSDNLITFNTPNNPTDVVTVAYFHGGANVSTIAKFDVILNRLTNSLYRFQIPNAYLEGSLMVFLNGQLQRNGVDKDFTVDSMQVVFNYEVKIDDVVTAGYLLS